MNDNKKKDSKKKINIAMFCIAIFFFICILFAIGRYFRSNIFFADDKVHELFKNQNIDFIDIYKASKNNFFACMGDKIKLIDIVNNKEIWSDEINFTAYSNDLILQSKGQIFAIGNLKSNKIVIYNLSGKLYETKMDAEENLLAFFVNQNGNLVYISTKKNVYNIVVYNKTGKKVFTNIYSEENIFPIGADISPDGKILAVVYTDLNNIETISKIVFMSLESDKDIFASLQENNNFIYGINFISNKKVVLLSPKHVICKKIEHNSINELWRINFDKIVSNIEFNKHFLIAKFDGGDKKNSIKCGSIIDVYDIGSGHKINNFSLESDVDFIFSDSQLNCVLLTGRDDFFIIDLVNNKLFHDQVVGAGDYKKAYFLDKKNEILFLGNNKISVVAHDIFKRGELNGYKFFKKD